VLDRAVEILTENVRSSTLYHGPEEFEQGVLDMLRVAARGSGFTVSPTFHKHAFPDIRVNGFGVEVKYTMQDTWLAVGNSIFEGMRDPNVSKVYVVIRQDRRDSRSPVGALRGVDYSRSGVKLSTIRC